MSKAEAPDPDAIRCDDAQRLLFVFASARLDDVDQERLRTHLAECSACSEDYREAVRALAGVGRAVRERRFAPSPDSFSRTARARAAIARAASARRGRFGIRLFVTTAALIFLFTAIVPKRERPLGVQWEAGDVRAAELRLGPDRTEQPIVTGDWCYTRARGRATVRGAGLTLRLAEQTVLLVEDAELPRLRLQHGAVDVDGQGVVTSPSAVVQIDGRARIEIVRGTLRTHCETGTLTVLDSSGEEVLVAGESLAADPRTGLFVRS